MNTVSALEALASAGVSVFERGWLSANNVLIQGNGPTALVDSGYCSHANQTLALVKQALEGRPLDLLLNTHLHSDHCGGNAALQNAFPELETRIPPGQAQAVSEWDPVALTYTPTGQECPRFVHQGLLQPGSSVQLGSLTWDVHGAKGHDPHSIILHQPATGILISADSLWENGFGVVFPELEGVDAFDEVRETLDLIEALEPRIVIPGHGPVFHAVGVALQRARSRLAQFRDSPDKHLRHAIKVLIKFRLLDWQKVPRRQLVEWAQKTPYLQRFIPPDEAAADWMDRLLHELERSSALRLEQNWVINC
jgi:glyoxylase-like metal-dependent hydrolase (beta-lactamase superfamily II)